MSVWSDFDQWVEDTFDPDTEFTPTFEEFMWSFVKLPGHLLRGPSTEDLLYFNLHLAHFGAHYAWHASRVGAYAAWDTFAGWRMSQMLSRPYRVAQVLATPVGLGAAVILGGTAYVAHKIHTDPDWQRRAQRLGSGMDFSSHWAQFDQSPNLVDCQ